MISKKFGQGLAPLDPPGRTGFLFLETRSEVDFCQGAGGRGMAIYNRAGCGLGCPQGDGAGRGPGPQALGASGPPQCTQAHGWPGGLSLLPGPGEPGGPQRAEHHGDGARAPNSAPPPQGYAWQAVDRDAHGRAHLCFTIKTHVLLNGRGDQGALGIKLGHRAATPTSAPPP